MTRKSGLIAQHSVICAAVCALLLALCSVLDAQQANKVHRIGFLSPGNYTADASRVESFRQGLRELGYEDGRNISIEFRWANGKFEQLPDLAMELVRLKVDLVVAVVTKPHWRPNGQRPRSPLS